MSSFSGQLEDFHNVLIDNFSTCDAYTCFFLSHCHSDHMKGITQLFSKLSQKSDHYLYCSPISSLILLNKFGTQNEKFIKKLTEATVIEVPEGVSSPAYRMTVTPLPAGHCPGSVMFLLETVKKRILYTGDFRITNEDIKKFKFLHKNNEVKHIDKLYFDSTFFNETYWYFPLRTQVVDEICEIVRKWINKSNKHNVIFETSALYGYEYVFVEVGKRVGCQIHVSDSVYDLYWNVPEVGSFLTKDCNNTKVHAFPVFQTKCKSNDDDSLKIKLSAQWFKTTRNNFKTVNWKQVSNNRVSVCFATHCSCSELIDFLKYLQPDEVMPCCVPVGCSQNQVSEFVKDLMWSIPKRKRARSPESAEGGAVLNKNYKFKIKFGNSQENSRDFFWETS